MPSPTDWGRVGLPGFRRDPGNEQIGTLGPNGVFTGQWTRVDKCASFAILYGTHAPFTMQIQWSSDGVAQDTDPFATITPQVRNRLGLYSVISFQSTFFRPRQDTDQRKIRKRALTTLLTFMWKPCLLSL